MEKLCYDALGNMLCTMFDSDDNSEVIISSEKATIEEIVEDWMSHVEGYLNTKRISKMRHTHSNVVVVSYEDGHKSYLVFSPCLEKNGKNNHKEIYE